MGERIKTLAWWLSKQTCTVISPEEVADCLAAVKLELVPAGAVERAFREGHGCGVLTETPAATAPQMVKKASNDWPFSMAQVEAGGKNGS